MRFFKRFLVHLPLYVLFLLLSSMLWIWLFGFASDTVPGKKITLYIDSPVVNEKALDLALEKDLPEGIRMVRAHAFSYAMFNVNDLKNADLYIVPVSKIDDYADSFLSADDCPAVAEFYSGKEGVKVYDAASKKGVASSFVSYLRESEEEPGVWISEDFYLFFGANSIHTGTEGSSDGAAFEIARLLLAIEE